MEKLDEAGNKTGRDVECNALTFCLFFFKGVASRLLFFGKITQLCFALRALPLCLDSLFFSSFVVVVVVGFWGVKTLHNSSYIFVEKKKKKKKKKAS
jgi:hypothetical protein